MATTTQQDRGNGNVDTKRRFQIGRKNGEKTGEPVFLEWLRELPAEKDRAGRRFETRGDGKRHYETFAAVDGILIGMRTENRAIVDEERTFLYVTLDDGNDVFDIEVGDFDGRYALNLMQRLCSPYFDPQKTTRLSPYALNAENGKTYIGVAVHNGTDKIESRKPDDTFQPAHPTTSEFKGKILYDFSPVARWYMEYLQKNLLPRLPSNAWNTPAPAPQPAETPRTAHAAPAGRPPSNDRPVSVPANDPGFPETPPPVDDSDLPF